MKRIEGGICAVSGVRAAGVRRGRYGLAVIAASGAAAGMFTTNRVQAAPLQVTAQHLAEGRLNGVIANSGCANAYTGQRGLEDARAMARLLAGHLGADERRIAVASTGVIGRYLDLPLIAELFEQAKSNLRSDASASVEAERAIMTTDTRVKEIAVEHEGLRVAGIVKGAGMIEPNVATMLLFPLHRCCPSSLCAEGVPGRCCEGQLQYAHSGRGHQHQRHSSSHCHWKGQAG